jgi:hypothetical protein
MPQPPPIDPDSDPRITHKTARLNGYTYHYLHAVPKDGKYTHTVFLVRFLSLSCIAGGICRAALVVSKPSWFEGRFGELLKGQFC